MEMTREQRLELLKQIEKDIFVSSIESTFLDEAKSCAIHSAIEELEQGPVGLEMSKERVEGLSNTLSRRITFEVIDDNTETGRVSSDSLSTVIGGLGDMFPDHMSFIKDENQTPPKTIAEILSLDTVSSLGTYATIKKAQLKINDLYEELNQDGALEQETKGKTEVLSCISMTIECLEPVKALIDELSSLKEKVLSAGEVLHFSAGDYKSGYTGDDMLKLANTILAMIRARVDKTKQVFGDGNVYKEGVKTLGDAISDTCSKIEIMLLNAFCKS